MMAVGRQVGGENRAAGGPGDEPRDPKLAARRNEQERQPNGPNGTARARDVRAHPTTTKHRAACPAAKT